MQKYSHKCIKCSQVYQDDEVDDYYCQPCNEQKNAIAKEVDKKIAMKPKKVIKSDLQIYDEIRKARGSNFVSIKDLGIKL